MGVSASKRVGNAVQRNRVKRLLRVAASGALPVIPDGTDVVLIAKPSALGKTCQTITADVRSALTKAGIPC